MAANLGPSAAAGLERSCGEGDFLHGRAPFEGVELLRARFSGRAFSTHRHDTYAVCVTEVGVQAFDYRGRTERSLPGQVTVLHPDEPHDGRPGADGAFGYRIVYVEPALIAEAARAIRGRPAPLPFVPTPVVEDPDLAHAVTAAFAAPAEPGALDAVVLALAEGLLRRDPSSARAAAPRVDTPALARARELLRHRRGVVRSEELEALTGLGRYELARQFRAAFGTSPYRYSLLRRLDFARRQIAAGASLARAALDAGFADQAHLTRAFRAAYGLTPGRYARLTGAAGRT